RLRIVYVGEEGVDGPPNVDDFVSWVVTSSYWSILEQYGASKGMLEPSVRLRTADVFPPGTVKEGLISYADLDARIAQLIHPELAGRDAGADADANAPALDASFDADADPSLDANVFDANVFDATALVPASEAYMIMLPSGVNVTLGQLGTRTFQTCIDAGG